VFASTNHVYGVVKTPPAYIPIDEAHPLRPAGPYALSKAVAEQMADYFTDQHGLEILSFRFMGVRSPARLDSDIESIVQNPERGIHLLWTRTDARDAALACRLALETVDVESGPYNITGRNVVLDQDSAELVKRYFGNQVEIREGLVGRASPLSCARAEEAFGYRPQYDWSLDSRFPEETEP
jgi:nucleoside-diphosphate-sugar epimerase